MKVNLVEPIMRKIILCIFAVAILALLHGNARAGSPKASDIDTIKDIIEEAESLNKTTGDLARSDSSKARVFMDAHEHSDHIMDYALWLQDLMLLSKHAQNPSDAALADHFMCTDLKVWQQTLSNDEHLATAESKISLEGDDPSYMAFQNELDLIKKTEAFFATLKDHVCY